MTARNKASNLLDVGARNHPIKDPFFAVRVGVVSWARLALTMPASVTSREIRPTSTWLKCAGINRFAGRSKIRIRDEGVNNEWRSGRGPEPDAAHQTAE